MYVRRTLRNGRIKTPKTKASLRAVPLQAWLTWDEAEEFARRRGLPIEDV